MSRTHVPWSYEGAPRALVLALKVRNMRSAAEPLIQGLARCCRGAHLDVDLVTWVPARPRDTARRGFDHAQVLANGLSRRVGLPTAALLTRRGRTRDQAGLGREERRANLASAFGSTSAGGLRILLVDDVLTTGATAEACAAALSKAGAATIELAVACRA